MTCFFQWGREKYSKGREAGGEGEGSGGKGEGSGGWGQPCPPQPTRLQILYNLHYDHDMSAHARKQYLLPVNVCEHVRIALLNRLSTFFFFFFFFNEYVEPFPLILKIK